MNKVVLAGVLLASGIVALGAPIDGKWTVTTQGRQGDQTQVLTITSSGMTLTGKLDPGNGMTVDISEGMLMNSDVTFKVTRMGRDGNPQVTTYKGTLSGDELKLTPTREGGGGGQGKGGGGGGGGRGPQELVFKRVK